MSTSLEIRNSAAGKLFAPLGLFLAAAVMSFFAVRGVASGATGSAVLPALGALASAGAGLFMARGAFDTGVQVVLDDKGFRDRRGGDVTVPWDKVACVQLVYGNHGGAAMVNFTLAGDVPHDIKYAPSQALSLALPFAGRNTVHMEVASLDIDPPAVIEAVRKLAPKVKVIR